MHSHHTSEAPRTVPLRSPGLAALAALAAVTLLTGSLTGHAQLIVENFNYANGPIGAASGGNWNVFSPGTTDGSKPVNIVNGQAALVQHDTSSNRDDIGHAFAGGLQFNTSTDHTTQLYAGFDVNFSHLPTGSGSFFANFKSTTANEYYARVGADVDTAGSGKFRLGLANETWNAANSTEFPLDLDLSTTYRVVLRWDMATDKASLWVNPAGEGSASITASDTPTLSGFINEFSLRQGTTGSGATFGAPGDLTVDNLVVGTSFSQVVSPVPEPATTAGAVAAGLAGFALWRRRRCRV